MTVALYYHSVGNSPLSVSTSIFLQHLTMIKSFGFKGVSLANFLAANEYERKSQVILTFDDCFLDSFENAIPLLLNFSFSATFYAVPGYDNLIRWGSVSKQNWSDSQSKDYIYPFQFMTSSERRQALFLGMEIGCHTMNHKNLNLLPPDLQYAEIFDSKNFLQEDIQTEVKSFCYPRGLYNNYTLDILLNLGFTSACTTKPGYVNEKTLNLEIPRFGVGNDLYALESILRGNGSNISIAKKLKRKIQYFFKSSK